MWNNSPERTLSQEKASMFDPKDCCEEMSIIAEYRAFQKGIRHSVAKSAKVHYCWKRSFQPFHHQRSLPG